MRRIIFILGMVAFVVTLGSSAASAGDGSGGFAWLRDNDGDGIPNGMDDDWVRPADGTGYMMKHRFGASFVGPSGKSNGGYFYQNQNRQRRNPCETRGDCLGIRLRLQDGSCQ
jgi:hypothetical protein